MTHKRLMTFGVKRRFALSNLTGLFGTITILESEIVLKLFDKINCVIVKNLSQHNF